MIKGKSKPRILLDFNDTQRSKFEKYPATNFAETFIKAYKKVNETK